ncbi:MAG: ribonuclease HII [Acholeplasmataceae bacterium]|nr:ribonuclease HII [Acholeplasmataceae bacterium]
MIYEYEEKLLKEGYKLICGVDEVGRGPLAGPVVAAAVILKPGVRIDVTDSKKLTKKRRRKLVPIIKENSIAISISFIDNKEIDKINILEASKKAMLEAIKGLKVKPDYVLSDAIKLEDYLEVPTKAIIKGDLKVASIASASIIAKEARDDYMETMDLKYPKYGFKKHMGYPTKLHLEKIKEYGICEIHRKTFKPIKDMIK